MGEGVIANDCACTCCDGQTTVGLSCMATRCCHDGDTVVVIDCGCAGVSVIQQINHRTHFSLRSAPLLFRASAIAAAPSAPILLLPRLCTPKGQKKQQRNTRLSGLQ